MQFQFNKGTLVRVCETSNLINAFKLVKRNKGALGIDGITIEKFGFLGSIDANHFKLEKLIWNRL